VLKEITFVHNLTALCALETARVIIFLQALEPFIEINSLVASHATRRVSNRAKAHLRTGFANALPAGSAPSPLTHTACLDVERFRETRASRKPSLPHTPLNAALSRRARSQRRSSLRNCNFAIAQNVWDRVPMLPAPQMWADRVPLQVLCACSHRSPMLILKSIRNEEFKGFSALRLDGPASRCFCRQVNL